MKAVYMPDNADIADVLRRVADLLEAQEANPYQVRAYRKAADAVENAEWKVGDLAWGRGDANLEDIPGVGKSIAGSIKEYVCTGRLRFLERLEGQVSPEDLFSTVPGVGEVLAHRIAQRLHLETLEELELAAHDGRLETVPGIGRRRLRGIRDSLEALLSRSSRRRARRFRQMDRDRPVAGNQAVFPGVAAILDIDEAYRRKASEGRLKTIAPRRFNPEGEAWLPIMHAELGEWDFTALFSNTARAHELDKTRDWVVVYFQRDGHEDQATVVTEQGGPLKGRRVVRGHERACRAYYGV